MPQYCSMRKIILGSALFLAALSVPGCDLSKVLKQVGYTELKPPSQLMKPGTMVWIEKANPFRAGLICTQETSLGANFKPINSPTASSTLKKAENVKVTLSADLLSIVQGRAEMSAVHSIDVTLHNPVMYELTDMDVINSIPKRDPVCAQAVSSRLRAGFPVTMIAKALMADVVYSITWKQGIELDAKARMEALSGLAPHLGVAQGVVRENTISGKSLFWGVQDDVYLSKLALNHAVSGSRFALSKDMAILTPKGVPPARTSDQPEQLMSPEDVVSIDFEDIDTDRFIDEPESEEETPI